MGRVSFKISNTGLKYCPSLKKRKPPSENNKNNNSNDGERNSEAPVQATSSVLDSSGSKRKRPEFACSKIGADHVALSLLSTTSEGSSLKTEHEASFALNLFLDGFSIGKPTEQGKQPPSAQELTETLHPYSRTCKTLFQAIDNGLLPGDLLEEIPCKYVNGSVVCEVRDYRKGSPISGDSVSSGEGFPVVQKVHLCPTTENIVKDIASMAEESWEYSDLMEIESRILKAVRPKLCLDPTPMLGRPCEKPNANKVNLGVLISRRQRIQTGGLPKVMSNNLSHGKKVHIEGTTEKPKSQSGISGSTPFEDSGIFCSQEISVPNSAGICSSIPVNRPKFRIESGQDAYRLGMLAPSNSLPLQSGLNRPRLLHSQGNQSPIPSPVSSVNQHSMQDWTNTLTDARNMSGSILGKRENKDLAMTGKLDLKKQKLEQTSMDKIQQQNVLPKIDTKLTRDQQRKDMPIMQNQNNEAMYFPDMSVQRHPQQVKMDDDQKLTGGEMPVEKSKLSPHVVQKSTVEFKVKEEQLDFDRGQIGIERENQEVERRKDNHLLMELDNDQSGTQQMLYQNFSQQQCGKSSFPWQSVGQIGEKDQKRDEFLPKRKVIQSPREIVKQEIRSVMPLQSLAKSGDLSQPLTSSAVSSISLGPHNNITAPVGLMQQEKSQGLASVSTSVPSVNPSHIDSQLQQAPQSISFGRRRSNSLPRTTSASGVASPGSVTNAMIPSNVNSPSTGTAPIPSSVIKPDQSVVIQGQQKQFETLSSLVSVVQRHGLHMRKKAAEEILSESKKNQPSLDLLIFALASATNNEDQKDIKGPKSLANSLVGGDVNARKTRVMNFVRVEHILQANSVPVLIKRNQVRLVMCERAKDGMVEAVVQFGDEQEDDSTNSCPYDVLPSLCNTHSADRLSEQFRVLMEKDGYELVDDKIQPIQQRQQSLTPNVSSITHAMAVGSSALGNNMNQLPNSHLMVNQNMPGSAAACGIPSLTSLPLSSTNVLASSRLPPSGNAPTRQIVSGFMQSGLGTSSKPLQFDHNSQLAAVQQRQHQHQLQQHPQNQLQRSPQLGNPNNLAQLNGASQTSNQQMNSQIMSSANQIQMQLLQQQKRQQQQQQHQQLQRKMMIPGSLGGSVGVLGVGSVNGLNSMNNVGMPVSGGPQGGLNAVGLNGMSSVVGMGGLNSPSMGAMAHLANINNSPVGGIGQNSIVNMMGQHIGPNITSHAAAAAAALRMSQVRGRPGAIGSPAIRNNIENNITGISASNQAHNSANMAILGQQQGRGNMSSLLNRGMGPPKLGTGLPGVAGQNIYMNHQLNNQSSQINSQQPLNQQQQLNVQQQLNASQAPSSQQPLSSQPLLNMPNQLNHQQQINPQLNSQSQINSHQQMNPQQLSSQSQLNPQQMNVGNLGSLVGGPSSPQRSSQTLGSVGSITSSPMELQSANRGNSITTGQ